jgi:hypothetical protein
MLSQLERGFRGSNVGVCYLFLIFYLEKEYFSIFWPFWWTILILLLFGLSPTHLFGYSSELKYDTSRCFNGFFIIFSLFSFGFSVVFSFLMSIEPFGEFSNFSILSPFSKLLSSVYIVEKIFICSIYNLKHPAD